MKHYRQSIEGYLQSKRGLDPDYITPQDLIDLGIPPETLPRQISPEEITAQSMDPLWLALTESDNRY